MPSIPVPRLLPLTIAMLAIVLAAKSTLLVRSAVDSGQHAAFVTTAWAGGQEAPAASANALPSPTAAAKSGETAGKPASPTPANATADKSGQKPRGDAVPPPPASPTIAEGPPPMTESEKAILLDLRQRRRELEAREATLAGRESMVAAAEQKLTERVGELQGLQKKLEALDASHRQQEDAAWQGLVKVYETMKPRDAAVIFNDLGMQVLLAVVGHMKEAKAAAVLAAMLPDKAREVTTQLAMIRTNGQVTDGAAPSGAASGNPFGAPSGPSGSSAPEPAKSRSGT